MIKRIFLLLIINYTVTITAQEPFYKTYSWDTNPDYTSLEISPEENIIAFKEKIVTEFYFNDKNSLVEYFMEHRLLWLNSDEIIEEYNKIYLPYSSNSELLVNKARVITKAGKVLELDESKILTAKDEETKKTYKYFAFEGIEKGSFIEYYYIIKRYPQYKGKKLSLQYSYNKKNVEFDLFSPKNLVFKFKSYNGLQNVMRDTLVKDKLHWKLHLDLVEKLEKEEKAPYNALRKYLIYKLDRNTSNNTYDISSYRNVAKNIYNYLYKKLSKKEVSSIKKIVKDAGLNKASDDISKIRKFENYVKENFYFSEINSEQLEDIETVISNKTGNEVGLIRVYIASLKSVGINTEIVLTSDRFETKFDDEFEANNFLTHYLLYFPSVKKCTSVDKLEARLGFPPPELTDNYGLFIKEVALGDYKNGIGKIKYINAPEVEVSEDKLLIDVSFDKEDLSLSNIKIDRSFSGYYARYIQPFFHLANEESLNELYDQLIKSINESITIKDKTAFNNKTEHFGVKPFKLVANTESNAFMDKAGKKYLFKLGELIGPQIEMYQEKQRNLPLESDFKRRYERIITIKIPKGFKVANLDDINIQNLYENDGDKLLEFHSYYKINDNILTVYANESYKLNKIETDFFEDYRKVINSAADFNKIVLVFEPK